MAATRRPKFTAFEEALLFELRAIRLAIVDHSTNTGKWLSAVAKAASTPDDNSAEVQKIIDQTAAELNASAKAQEDALKQFNRPKEN